MLWKCYFGLMVMLIAISILAMGHATGWVFHAVDILNLVFMILGLVGVFGYAFRRKIGGRQLWAAIIVVTLAYQITYSFIWDPRYGAAPATTFAEELDTILPLIPMYVALALYYRSHLLD